MKVVFTMGGITHYLSPLLDNVVRKGVDVVMVIPSVKDNQTIGKGVKLVNNEALYQVRYSEIKQGWYGKTILTDLKTILNEEKPDIVIIDSIQTMYREEISSAPGSVALFPAIFF